MDNNCMEKNGENREKMTDRILVTQSSMPPFEEYMEMIKPLWESHWLTNMGQYHKELESELEKFLDVPAVSLMVNGHMALELAIQSMKFPEGGEVITTPFTFISTTHAIIRNKLKPVFCDIRDDYTIDYEKIEELVTDKTVAIIPVHVYGNICNIEEIQRIAYKYDLKVIYDAAHAFGEKYKGKSVAGFGDMSILSFHATKVFNTIEGGAVCCHQREQYEKLYNLKNFGIRSEELVVAVGGNAKMNEFQAAMGLCNLRHIETEIQKRKILAERYRELLKDTEEIRLNQYQKEVTSNYAYFPVLFSTPELRDKIYQKLMEHEIYSRKYFYPITADQACFRNEYRKLDLEYARFFSERILVLPLHAALTTEQVERIAGILADNMSMV